MGEDLERRIAALEHLAAAWWGLDGKQESIHRSVRKVYIDMHDMSDRLRETQNKVERLETKVQRMDDMQQEMSKRLCVQSDQIQALMQVPDPKATRSKKPSGYGARGAPPQEENMDSARENEGGLKLYGLCSYVNIDETLDEDKTREVSLTISLKGGPYGKRIDITDLIGRWLALNILDDEAIAV